MASETDVAPEGGDGAVGADIRAVKELLERDGLSVVGPSADDDLSMRVCANGHDWTMLVVATDDDRLVVYSFLPSAPHRPTADIDAVLGRINAGMILGNFEFDEVALTIRFKTSAGVAGVAVSEPLIRQLVYSNIAAVERYLPVLQALARAETSVPELLELVAATDA